MDWSIYIYIALGAMGKNKTTLVDREIIYKFCETHPQGLDISVEWVSTMNEHVQVSIGLTCLSDECPSKFVWRHAQKQKSVSG